MAPSRPGLAAGGYDSIVEAAQKMARVQKLTFKPNAQSPRHLRPALCGIPHVARLLRPRRERRDEAAEDFEKGDGGEVSCQRSAKTSAKAAGDQLS